MKKPVMIAAILFLVCVAAGAGARVALAPPSSGAVSAANGETAAVENEPAHPATTAPTGIASKLPLPSVAGDKRTGLPSQDGEEAASTSETEPNGLPAGPQDTSTAVLRASSSARESTPGLKKSSATKASADQVEFRELSNILSQVSPLDATRFLVHLEDAQVIGILQPMSVSRAAIILARFPEKRAASLKKRLLDLPSEMP